MSDLLEALERAEQALRDVRNIEDRPSLLYEDTETSRRKMEDHISDLKKELEEQDTTRLQEWNRRHQYQPRHQEEMRIP